MHGYSSPFGVSIFMEDHNDRSFIGVMDNSSNDSAESCESMVIVANNIYLAMSLVEHKHVRTHKATHHWVLYPQPEWWFCLLWEPWIFSLVMEANMPPFPLHPRLSV